MCPLQAPHPYPGTEEVWKPPLHPGKAKTSRLYQSFGLSKRTCVSSKVTVSGKELVLHSNLHKMSETAEISQQTWQQTVPAVRRTHRLRGKRWDSLLCFDWGFGGSGRSSGSAGPKCSKTWDLSLVLWTTINQSTWIKCTSGSSWRHLLKSPPGTNFTGNPPPKKIENF